MRVYKDLGYEDVKDEKSLKEKIKASLLEHKEHHAEDHYIDELIKKACEDLEVEINPEIVEDEINRMLNQYNEQLKMQGLSLEQYLSFTKGTIDDLKKMMEPEANNRIKTRYLLEAICDKENIEVSHEEIHAELDKMAEMYNAKPEEIVQMIGGEEALEYDLKMRKAIDILKNN